MSTPIEIPADAIAIPEQEINPEQALTEATDAPADETKFDVKPIVVTPPLDPSRLNSYIVRPDLVSAVAHWDSKKAVVHRAGTLCANRTLASMTTRSREWMLEAFAKAQAEESEGVARTLDFCTRCATQLKSKPTKAASTAALNRVIAEINASPEDVAKAAEAAEVDAADKAEMDAVVEAEEVVAPTPRRNRHKPVAAKAS